jgi:hypothetical protein
MPTLTGTQNERRALNVRGKRNATPSHAVVMSLAPPHRGAFSLPIANHPRAKMARRTPSDHLLGWLRLPWPFC